MSDVVRGFFAAYPGLEQTLRSTFPETMYGYDLEEQLAAAQKKLEWHRRHLLRLRWRARRERDNSGCTREAWEFDWLLWRQEMNHLGLKTARRVARNWPSLQKTHGPSPAGWQAYLEAERAAQSAPPRSK